MPRRFLNLANRLFTLVISLVLVIAVLYAGYALWDNKQIYASAKNHLDDVISKEELAETLQTLETSETPHRISSDADTGEDSGRSEETGREETKLEKMFRELKDINEDIGAWITMPGTAINYAVVQGNSNIKYVSTDIYGNFAIVGSIFLDSRNQADYSDTYNLLYGHNMSEHRMFSDVNLYKEEENFNKNQKGYIYLPTGAHWLQTVSVIVTPASNSWMFNPQSWSEITPEQMFELVQTDALFISEDGMKVLNEKIKAGELPRIVALSTCSNEFTDARTILLTVIDP